MNDTGGRRDEAEVARFRERFAAVLTEAGFPRMPARVFVALLVTDSGTLTATELVEQLRTSAGSISAAIRYLTQLELVDREHAPGSRRHHYRVREDLWYAATMRREARMRRWDPTLRDGITALGEHTPAGARLIETRNFFAFVQAETPALLDRWNAYRAGRSGSLD